MDAKDVMRSDAICGATHSAAKQLVGLTKFAQSKGQVNVGSFEAAQTRQAQRTTDRPASINHEPKTPTK